MNNWLAFSLSSHELFRESQSHAPGHMPKIMVLNEVHGGDVNPTDRLPSQNPLPVFPRPDAHFGILEGLSTSHQSQDWSGINFKGGSSDQLSMLFGGNKTNQTMEERPKLEDFLGGANTFKFSGCNNGIPQGYCASQEDYNIFDYSPSSHHDQLPVSTAGSSTHRESSGHGSARTLSVSMGGVSSNSVGAGDGDFSGDNKCSSSTTTTTSAVADGQSGAIEAVSRKSIESFGQRTSIYRGVTRHRWTGRYEAHLWDNSCRREGQTRKGRQVYLGGYDKEEKAARAYDLAALKYWGTTTTTNFPISNYEQELEEMKLMTRQEFVASLRRKSSGFSRGASKYRGVTRLGHHQHGRWQARIGRVAGNKDLYLGTFSTQEEAAEAYDIAAIKFRGLNAVTNFEMSRYDVNSILESSTLPIQGGAKRLKDVDPTLKTSGLEGRRTNTEIVTSQFTDGINGYVSHPSWPSIAFHGHNFFQPSSMQNIMSLEHSSMDNSSAPCRGAYGLPISTVVENQSCGGYGGCEVKLTGYENLQDSIDSFNARNGYYMSQQAAGILKASGFHEKANYNNWMQQSVPRIANNFAACHAAPVFPMWNKDA